MQNLYLNKKLLSKNSWVKQKDQLLDGKLWPYDEVLNGWLKWCRNNFLSKAKSLGRHKRLSTFATLVQLEKHSEKRHPKNQFWSMQIKEMVYVSVMPKIPLYYKETRKRFSIRSATPVHLKMSKQGHLWHWLKKSNVFENKDETVFPCFRRYAISRWKPTKGKVKNEIVNLCIKCSAQCVQMPNVNCLQCRNGYNQNIWTWRRTYFLVDESFNEQLDYWEILDTLLEDLEIYLRTGCVHRRSFDFFTSIYLYSDFTNNFHSGSWFSPSQTTVHRSSPIRYQYFIRLPHLGWIRIYSVRMLENTD